MACAGGLLTTEYERFYRLIVWNSLLEKYDAAIENGESYELMTPYDERDGKFTDLSEA
jgi:hypothetical protein